MADISAAVDTLKEGVSDAGKKVAAALPLWVIIVVVVVGTGLLALLVGLCCLCLCRRRRGRKTPGVGGGGGDSPTVIHGYSDITAAAAAAPSSERGGSRSSGEGGRHKLRKRPPSSGSSSSSFGNDRDGGGVVVTVVDDRGVEVQEVEVGRGEPEFRNMAMAPARKASLLVIPPLLSGLRASIVSIGGGRRSAGRGESGGLNISNDGAANSSSSNNININWHRRRTSEAWIDDDALHGPEVSPTKRPAAGAAARRSRSRSRSLMKSWGASIRESWPLKSPSPTLPLLPHFGSVDGGADGGHESFAMFQYNKDYDDGAAGDSFVPNLPPPLGTAARQRDGQQLSPPRQLPKPPDQALLAANASTAGLRPVGSFYGVASAAASNSPRGRGLSYYKYEDTEQPVKSSGSPRSKVQRGVGVGTGVVGPRGRGPSADSTMTQILKDTEKRLQGAAVTGVAMRNNRSSSSPPKRPPPPLGLGPDAVTVALVRSRSRTPSPTKASGRAHGGASSHARQGSQASFASEPDSLLDDSTPSLPYHGLTSPSRSKPSPQSSSHKRRPSLVPSFTSSASSLSTIHSEEEALTPNTTAPNSSIPFGMNQIAGLGDPFMPSKTSTPASKRVPGSAERGAQDSGNRSHRRDKTPNARSESPLSPVTGNMRSPDATPTRGGNRHATVKSVAKSDNAEPGAVLQGGSPTKAIDRGAPAPLLKRLSDLAPPFRSRDETPDVAHPSPALSNNANGRLSSFYDFYADMPESSSQNNSNQNEADNNRRRAGGGQARMVSSSPAASVSSSLYSDTGAAERERERQNAALSRISMLLNREIGQQQQQQQQHLPSSSSRPKPTVRAVSQNFNHRHHQQQQQQQQQQQLAQYGASGPRVSATVAAVAELRRMNSQVSAYSTAAASGYSDTSSLAAAAANIRPESVVPPRGGAAAARNYLALGSPVKSSPDREVRGRYEMGDDVGDAMTPTRNNNNNRRVLGRRAASVERGGSSGSGSEDGMSLYDQDGFYITPARRHGLKF